MEDREADLETLEEKVENIDRRLERVESAVGETNRQKEDSEEEVENSEDTQKVETSDEESVTGFESEIGLKWLGRVGILAFVIGIAFSIRYAVQKELIGYVGRILLGLVVGTGLSGIGLYMKEKTSKYHRFSRVLMGGGSAILYFTIYASYYFESYREAIGITLWQNMFLMSTLAAGIFVLAVKDNSKVFASEAIVLSYITAFLGLKAGIYMIFYIALLATVVSAISYLKNWSGIQLFGIAATFLIFPAWADKASFAVGMTFLSTVFVLFTVSNLARQLGKKVGSGIKVFLESSCVYLLPALFVILGKKEFIAEGIGRRYILSFIASPIQFIGYYLSNKKDLNIRNHYLYSGFPFLIIGVMNLFSGVWSTVITSAVAASFITYSFKAGKKEFRYSGYIMSLVAGLKVLTYDSLMLKGLSFSNLLSSARPFAYLSVISAFTVYYIQLRENREKITDRKYGVVERIYSWLIMLLILISVGLELENYLISLVWGAYGFYLLTTGIWRKISYKRKQSITVLGITTFKVFIWDLSGMDTLSRTISFLVLGTVLITASYIYTHNKDKIMDAVN